MNDEVLSLEDIRLIRVEWREEAKDRLRSALSVLAEMQHKAANPQHIRDIMRCLHTIKGTAAMVGYRDVSEFVHTLEEYCELFRNPEVLSFQHFSIQILDSGLTQLATAIDSTSPDQDPDLAGSAFTQRIQDEINQLNLLKTVDLSGSDRKLSLVSTAPSSLAAESGPLPLCSSCPLQQNPNQKARRNSQDSDMLRHRLATISAIPLEVCILIVHKEPAELSKIAELVRSILPKARLIEADSGKKAINLLSSVVGDQIDLVIAKWDMPDISGSQIAREMQQLRQRGELFAQAIMMVDAEPLDLDWQTVMALGVRDFTIMPTGSRELLPLLVPTLRETVINRQLAAFASYSQRVYLGFNRMERELDPQLQKGIRREVHNLLQLMVHAQRKLQEVQALPY